MYLTQHTDYGLRVLVYTAINDDTPRQYRAPLPRLTIFPKAI